MNWGFTADYSADVTSSLRSVSSAITSTGRLVPHSPRRGSNRVGAGSRSMVSTTSWMMCRSVSPAQITKHLASQILFHVKPPLSHDLSSGQGASTAFTEDVTNEVTRFFSFSLRCGDGEIGKVLFSCPIPTQSCAHASL